MNRKLSILVVWAGLVCLALPAFSAKPQGPPPPPGSTTIQNRNVPLTTTITGYTPSQKVSGTNQSFSVSVALASGANNTHLPKWTNYWLTDVTVKIGDTSVVIWLANGNTNTTAKSYQVQWDTTHFPMDGQGAGVTERIECTAN